MQADLANIVRYKLPLTAYRIEGWGFPGSSDNDGLALHSFMTPQRPGRRDPDTAAARDPPARLPAALAHAGLGPDPAGARGPHRIGCALLHDDHHRRRRSRLLDFTNPAAVRFWQRVVAQALDIGADGFMQDFGEEVLFDMHFHDGQTGVTMHNQYPILYDRATRQEITRYERAHPKRRQLFFFIARRLQRPAGDRGLRGRQLPR